MTLGQLDSLRGKSLAFVGDSMTRQQFQSFVSMIYEQGLKVEDVSITEVVDHVFVPGLSLNIFRVWAVYLVAKSGTAFKRPSEKRLKASLDLSRMEERLQKLLEDNHPDVLVFNTGLWHNVDRDLGKFFYEVNVAFHSLLKRAVQAEYVEKSRKFPLLVWRSTSRTHFEGGAFETGKCLRVEPLKPVDEHVSPTDWLAQFSTRADVDIMNFLAGKAIEDVWGRPVGEGPDLEAPFWLLDGEAFVRDRVEAHTVRRRKEAPPGHDCTHFCSPGVLDFWNEVLVHHISAVVNATTTSERATKLFH
eukprot:CAMPEP_0196668072 /NCGR_PEP_ID=MMETSP1086-20130531/65427_1 /TAXON_ID=77921 /ORGANISM="Cyanoptyche  gloeocystis , Strain SAG4.97" /LENGTH=302 /DNA_ID=CAMNT_0042005457 /DNA_START=708 /DNA_END=1616 /DNA_ORIENTATION=-